MRVGVDSFGGEPMASRVNQIEPLFDPFQSRIHPVNSVGYGGEIDMNLGNLGFQRADSLLQFRYADQNGIDLVVDPVEGREHQVDRFISHDISNIGTRFKSDQATTDVARSAAVTRSPSPLDLRILLRNQIIR